MGIEGFIKELHDSVDILIREIEANVAARLRNKLGFTPEPVQRLLRDSEEIMGHLNKSSTDSIQQDFDPILKRAVMENRRKLARSVESRKRQVSDAKTINRLDEELKPFNEIMKLDWFNKVEAVKIPEKT